MNPTIENTLRLARRILDYHAMTCFEFWNECLIEGDMDSELRKRYAAQYNCLVDLRARLTEGGIVDIAKWTGPEAIEKIYFETSQARQ